MRYTAVFTNKDNKVVYLVFNDFSVKAKYGTNPKEVANYLWEKLLVALEVKGVSHQILAEDKGYELECILDYGSKDVELMQSEGGTTMVQSIINSGLIETKLDMYADIRAYIDCVAAITDYIVVY